MGDIVLINITGRDRKGLDAKFTGILAQYNVTILDIGQAVIHEHISLGILAEIPCASDFARSPGNRQGPLNVDVPVHVEGEARYRELLRWLHQVLEQRPGAVVSHFEVTGLASKLVENEEESQPGPRPTLKFRVTLSFAWQGEEDPDNPDPDLP